VEKRLAGMGQLNDSYTLPTDDIVVVVSRKSPSVQLALASSTGRLTFAHETARDGFFWTDLFLGEKIRFLAWCGQSGLLVVIHNRCHLVQIPSFQVITTFCLLHPISAITVFKNLLFTADDSSVFIWNLFTEYCVGKVATGSEKIYAIGLFNISDHSCGLLVSTPSGLKVWTIPSFAGLQQKL